MSGAELDAAALLAPGAVTFGHNNFSEPLYGEHADQQDVAIHDEISASAA
jgi:hypothetical protein